MTHVTHVTPAAQSKGAKRFVLSVALASDGYLKGKDHDGNARLRSLCLCSGGYKGYVGHARLPRRPAYPAARGGGFK